MDPMTALVDLDMELAVLTASVAVLGLCLGMVLVWHQVGRRAAPLWWAAGYGALAVALTWQGLLGAPLDLSITGNALAAFAHLLILYGIAAFAGGLSRATVAALTGVFAVVLAVFAILPFTPPGSTGASAASAVAAGILPLLAAIVLAVGRFPCGPVPRRFAAAFLAGAGALRIAGVVLEPALVAVLAPMLALGGGVGLLVALVSRAEDWRARLAQAEADRHDRARFVLRLCQEMKLPLNAVRGFSELMREEMYGPLGSEAYRRYVDDIVKGAGQLGQQIDDTATLFALDAGLYTLRPADLPVRQALRTAARRAFAAADAKDVRITVTAPEGLSLHADPDALDRLLDQLLSNAIKFTPAGGTVDLDARLTPQDALLVTVRDSGVGIPQDVVRRVFRPFRAPVNRLVSDPHRGLGLGLPICAALARHHGATIDVTSHAGHGTAFEVTFPATAVRRPADNHAA